MHLSLTGRPKTEAATPEVVHCGLERDRPDRMGATFGLVHASDDREALVIELRQHHASAIAADNAGHLGEHGSAFFQVVKGVHQEYRAETARRKRQPAPVCLNELDAMDDAFSLGIHHRVASFPGVGIHGDDRESLLRQCERLDALAGAD
mgnify:CR=1 FL=1